MGYRYSYPEYKENMARAVGIDMGISFKHAWAITKRLRNMDLDKAQALLKRVLDKKEAIPFTKYTDGVGHRPGMGSGRYPKNACTELLDLLNQAEANAQSKGLGKCRIVHISAQRANRPFHYGRQSRIRMKRAHVELVVQESEKPKKMPKVKPAKKGEPESASKDATAAKSVPKSESKETNDLGGSVSEKRQEKKQEMTKQGEKKEGQKIEQKSDERKESKGKESSPPKKPAVDTPKKASSVPKQKKSESQTGNSTKSKGEKA